MSIALEHALVKQGYEEMENRVGRMVYVDKADHKKQVSIAHNVETGRFSFCFPLRDSAYSYCVYFDRYGDLRKYALERVSDGM